MYLQLCKDIDDKVGEGQACSALASAHEAAGEMGKAISFLEIFYELSQMTGELASQEEACTRLGKIYFQTEDYNNSVRYFEKVHAPGRQTPAAHPNPQQHDSCCILCDYLDRLLKWHDLSVNKSLLVSPASTWVLLVAMPSFLRFSKLPMAICLHCSSGRIGARRLMFKRVMNLNKNIKHDLQLFFVGWLVCLRRPQEDDHLPALNDVHTARIPQKLDNRFIVRSEVKKVLEAVHACLR
jgi:hypothetical protein